LNDSIEYEEVPVVVHVEPEIIIEEEPTVYEKLRKLKPEVRRKY
jgi:hypothetical protein